MKKVSNHNKTLIYTFKTFPYKKELKSIFNDIIILDKIKNDLNKLYSKIQLEKPNLILGIAKSRNNISTIEKYTINKFHRNKKILNIKNSKFTLNTLSNISFKVNNKPTDSFCNYSMFNIKYFIDQNNLTIPFIFIHITKEDLKHLITINNKI